MTRSPLKQLLLLFVAMPLSAVAAAGPPNTSLTELLACRHIASDAARLTCFDRRSAALASTGVPSPALPVPSAKPAAPAMQAALDPKHTFGLSHATIVRREAAAAGIRVKDLSHITAHVLRTGQGPEGAAIFYLDNGQVWEQLDPDGTDMYTKSGDSVEISRGMLGSFWLDTPLGHRCSVTRLR